jgi:hypothetical protein
VTDDSELPKRAREMRDAAIASGFDISSMLDHKDAELQLNVSVRRSRQKQPDGRFAIVAEATFYWTYQLEWVREVDAPSLRLPIDSFLTVYLGEYPSISVENARKLAENARAVWNIEAEIRGLLPSIADELDRLRQRVEVLDPSKMERKVDARIARLERRFGLRKPL